MFDRSYTRFHDKICKKAAQHFHCAVLKVFDRVKSVDLWSANIRKLAKDQKATVPQLTPLYASTHKYM